MIINYFPKQLQAHNDVLSNKYSLILFGGAVRGGKSIWGLTELLLLCEVFPGSRWCIIRENTEKLRTTTIPSFKKLNSRGRLRESPYEYTHYNGSVILFKSENYAQDKEHDWMKGLEVNGFLFEEINECQQSCLFKAFERTGTWILPDAQMQPLSIVMATCNPTQGWVKQLIYIPYKQGTLRENWKYIPSKVYDNEPFLKANPGYIDFQKQNLNRYEYEVFIEGNWDVQIKTGGEFLKDFDPNIHCKPIQYNDEKLLHVSIDSNFYPYIAITIWQLCNNQAIQIHELPCIDPYNTASRAGAVLVDYLKSIDYNSEVHLYGDASTKSSNNIDDKNRSFYEIFCEPIRQAGYYIEDKMFRSNPSVMATGDFINAVFENRIPNTSITVSEACTVSINDYIETKQDKEGGILKQREKNQKGITYEKNGHLLDTLRYFICKVYYDEFKKYSNRLTDYSQIDGFESASEGGF